MCFGVNSPQSTTSEASNGEKSTSGQGKSPSMAPHIAAAITMQAYYCQI